MGDAKRTDLRILAVIFVVLLVLVGIFVFVGGPLVEEAAAVFAPGIGLKTAALWGFGVTVALFVLFAVVAGDGLFGELQFMLGGFFAFFLIISLLIAWVF